MEMNTTKFTVIFVALIALLSAMSCGNDTAKIKTKPETPAALTDNAIDDFKGSFRYESREVGLVEKLYKELLNESKQLQKLEEDLEASTSNWGDLSDEFHNYYQKSNEYYTNAGYKVEQIQDSILRQKVLDVINQSEKNYGGKISKVTERLSTITKNRERIQDGHLVLKLLLTLPLIENYQDDHLPNVANYDKFIEEQEALIKRIDTITPN